MAKKSILDQIESGERVGLIPVVSDLLNRAVFGASQRPSAVGEQG